MSLSTGIALAAVALVTLSQTLHLGRRAPPQTIPSPRDTLLPKLSPTEATALPYPTDLLPGARDVATPYGVMRVYEWGPEDGNKVLFIHGDTTPAPILGPVARDLVDKGCRVMMFDLWGRGYSDTPLGVPHDARLFGVQILFAAASSSLSWTGAAAAGFSLVGYSLGGGIAMAFAANFPYLINSIILLAPGGIIRRLPDEYESIFYRYPSLLPSSFLRNVVGKTLGLRISHSTLGSSDPRGQSHKGPEIAQEAQVMGKKVLDIPGIVQWQYDNHKGFVHSFISTHRKHFNKKLLVIFGDGDDVIRAGEVSADLLEIIGEPEYLEIKVVAGDHGFPVPKHDEVARYIAEFCGT
ncbi:Alpha/Beta hydrolase protein [Usnea florida]